MKKNISYKLLEAGLLQREKFKFIYKKEDFFHYLNQDIKSDYEKSKNFYNNI